MEKLQLFCKIPEVAMIFDGRNVVNDKITCNILEIKFFFFLL